MQAELKDETAPNEIDPVLHHSLQRIGMYVTPAEGGVNINLEAMVRDTILAFKLGGFKLKDIKAAIIEMWPHIKAEAVIPDRAKN